MTTSPTEPVQPGTFPPLQVTPLHSPLSVAAISLVTDDAGNRWLVLGVNPCARCGEADPLKFPVPHAWLDGLPAHCIDCSTTWGGERKEVAPKTCHGCGVIRARLGNWKGNPMCKACKTTLVRSMSELVGDLASAAHRRDTVKGERGAKAGRSFALLERLVTLKANPGAGIDPPLVQLREG